MHTQLKTATESAQHYGIKKPSPTIFGKIEQVSKWCINPHFNDNGLGEQAAQLVIEDGRNLAVNNLHKDSDSRTLLIQTCNECEGLVNMLQKQHEDYSKNASDPQTNPANLKTASMDMISLGKQLQEKLNSLGHMIYKDLVQQVADDFIDINYPIRKLAEIIVMPLSESIFVFSKEICCFEF